MNETAQEFVLAGFLIFCRIGTCLVLLPTFSSPRIPTQARIYVAAGLSLAISPLIFDSLRDLIHQRSDVERIGLVFTELVTGGTIAGLARIVFSAIESAAQGISSLAGLTGIFNQEIASDETGTPLTSLLSLSATVMIFAADLHVQIFQGLLNSYVAIPPDTPLSFVVDLDRVRQVFTASFFIVLQLCGPFILFALIFNIALGLLNKLVPNIPVYFIASPFTAAGGLLLLQLLIKPTLTLFMAAFAGWLAWR